jgi:hypothetical protein
MWSYQIANFIKIGQQMYKFRTQIRWLPQVKYGFHYEHFFFQENSPRARKVSLKKDIYWISQTMDKRYSRWYQAAHRRAPFAHVFRLVPLE